MNLAASINLTTLGICILLGMCSLGISLARKFSIWHLDIELSSGSKGTVVRVIFGIFGAALVVGALFAIVIPIYSEHLAPRSPPLPEGTLEGVVKSEDGEPLSGAHVFVWSDESPSFAGHYITSDDGRYSISRITKDRRKKILVYKEGFHITGGTAYTNESTYNPSLLRRITTKGGHYED